MTTKAIILTVLALIIVGVSLLIIVMREHNTSNTPVVIDLQQENALVDNRAEEVYEEAVKSDDEVYERESVEPSDEVEELADNEIVAPVDTPSPGHGEYVAYDENAVRLAAADGPAILFFHASWCPTCRRFDEEIKNDLESIPADVTVFKVNYDKESSLKRKYGIRYQHTFVVVDENLNELSKWSGGGVDTLLSNIRG